MWANRMMQQWDTYIDEIEEARTHPLLQHKRPYFKKNDEISFKNYSQVMQLIDCSTLDTQTYIYKPKLFVLSFMYLVLGKI
jgi:hypothetical protein